MWFRVSRCAPPWPPLPAAVTLRAHSCHLQRHLKQPTETQSAATRTSLATASSSDITDITDQSSAPPFASSQAAYETAYKTACKNESARSAHLLGHRRQQRSVFKPQVGAAQRQVGQVLGAELGQPGAAGGRQRGGHGCVRHVAQLAEGPGGVGQACGFMNSALRWFVMEMQSAARKTGSAVLTQATACQRPSRRWPGLRRARQQDVTTCNAGAFLYPR